MDRVGDDAEQESEPDYKTQDKMVMDLEIPRQPIPEPSDGEVRVRLGRYLKSR